MNKMLVWAFACLLGLVACSKDDAVETPTTQEELTTVSIVANLADKPVTKGSEASGIANVSDANYDLRYKLEIRNALDGVLVHKDSLTGSTASKTASFSVNLVKGRGYKFTVWADFVADGSKDDLFYKTTAGLENIEMIESAFTINNEAKDAYFATVSVASAASTTITLKRPLAKIRFIATDYTNVSAADKIIIESGNIQTKYNTISSNAPIIYNKFNALTGDVSTSTVIPTTKTTVYYSANAVPGTGSFSNEVTLFWDYVFVPTAVGPHKLSFSLKSSTVSSWTKSLTAATIVVERNKLTTVKSNFFTGAYSLKITIDDEFEGFINEPAGAVRIGTTTYTSIADAMLAATSGQTILVDPGVFVEDVTIKSGVTIEGVGSSTVITGHIVMQQGSTLKNLKSKYFGTSVAGNRTLEAVSANATNITIDGVIFETITNHTFMLSNGNKQPHTITYPLANFTLKNSTISGPYWKGVAISDATNAKIIDNKFKGVNPFSTSNFTGSITVTGNEFNRTSWSDTQMPHITGTGVALGSLVGTWSPDILALIVQIKANTWIESPLSITSNRAHVIRIDDVFVGGTSAVPTDWDVATAL